MNVSLVISILAGAGVIAWMLYVRREVSKNAVRRQELKYERDDIRKFQEELGRLTKESIRDSEEFRERLKAYNEKYRNVPIVDDPAPGSDSTGGRTE
jgi:hypothetical protein